MTYYVTFRHRRPLEEEERRILMAALLRSEGKKLDFLIACVLPEATEMLFRAAVSPDGRPHELSNAIEPSKRKAGKKIIERTGERFPPFWEESYDRIVRDDAELEERWLFILSSPEKNECCSDADAYPFLWVKDSAEAASPLP